MNETSSGSTSVIVFLQWSKQKFDFEITVPSNTAAPKFNGRSFKELVYKLTKVPVERQKIVVSRIKSESGRKIKWWKGVLRDDFDFCLTLAQQRDASAGEEPIELSVTLMGSAEILAPNQKKTVFVEDMTTAEKKAAEERDEAAAMANVAAMIPALQIPPSYRQPPTNVVSVNSEYEEDSAYDRLVHGFSQLRIDALLRRQQTPENPLKDPFPPPPQMLGRVVLTLGLEVQRAYVNDLAVLSQDGTLVSGMDDGHIHMWKHCQKVKDLIHQSAGGIGIFDAFPGVDSVLALDNSEGYSPAAFATAGRGCIRVWDSEGESLLGRSSPLPFASPTGLIRIPIGYRTDRDYNSVLCLAARFRTAPPPSRRPRLVPQDNAGRRRVQQIETSESLVVADLTNLSKSVQILYVDAAHGEKASPSNHNDNFGSNPGKAKPQLRSLFLKSPNPVTCMESWQDGHKTYLVVGDSLGGLMFWKLTISKPQLAPASYRGSQSASALRATPMNRNNNNENNAPRITCTKLRYLKIASLEDPTETRSAIACLKYLGVRKQLFVSTKEIPPTTIASMSYDDSGDVSTTCFPIKPPQAVHCINVDAIINKSHHDPLDFTLDGHKDVVQSILPLPNGDLVTAGGRLDATTKIWPRHKLLAATGVVSDQGETASIASMLDASFPPVLKKPDTANVAGYVFGMELLEDFKIKNGEDGNKSRRLNPRTFNPFAVAVAQYNVVKIVI